MKILDDTARYFIDAGIESARLDAHLLLAHVLGMSREEMLMRGNISLSPQQEKQFAALAARRINREPMAHLLGAREFWGLNFKVSEKTLDPRADSETIIEALLHYKPIRSQPLKILDMGTGTGCLLLSALSEYPSAMGVGVDISDEALAVATANAEALGLKNRALFKKSDWNSEIKGVWDVVISNPPYIPTEEIPKLSPEVAMFEPKLALDGGVDGLHCYRAITRFLPEILAEDGIALLEIGIGQAKDVAGLVSANGLNVAQVACDLAGIERCIVIQK